MTFTECAKVLFPLPPLTPPATTKTPPHWCQPWQQQPCLWIVKLSPWHAATLLHAASHWPLTQPTPALTRTHSDADANTNTNNTHLGQWWQCNDLVDDDNTTTTNGDHWQWQCSCNDNASIWHDNTPPPHPQLPLDTIPLQDMYPLAPHIFLPCFAGCRPPGRCNHQHVQSNHGIVHMHCNHVQQTNLPQLPHTSEMIHPASDGNATTHIPAISTWTTPQPPQMQSAPRTCYPPPSTHKTTLAHIQSQLHPSPSFQAMLLHMAKHNYCPP